jgi:hypothetical protein
MVAICAALAITEYRRTEQIMSPLILFLGLSVLDIYAPAISYAISGAPALPPWLDRAAVVDSMPSAVVVFSVGLGIFVGGYALAHRWPRFQPKSPDDAAETFGRRRVAILIAAFVIATAWFLWTILFRAAAVGSLATYVANGLVVRWQPSPIASQYPTASYPVVLALQIGDAMLPVITLTIAIIVTVRAIHPAIRLGVLPAIGFIASLGTFFRGSVLVFFISLAAITELASDKRRPRRAQAAALVAVGVILFLSYGVIRDSAVLAAQHAVEAASRVQVTPTPPPLESTGGTVTQSPPAQSPRAPVVTSPPGPLEIASSEAVSYEAGRVLKGEGLIGLSSILAYYPTRLPYLGGKTIHDMLLLPVPRSIWHDKPSWYGIAEITRGMGEPEVTQSAVTIPGELYANYGPVGIVGMLCYGLVFGYVHRLRYGRRFRYAYAAILLPVLFVTFWMATTGLINGLLPLAPSLVVLALVFPPSRTAFRRLPAM